MPKLVRQYVTKELTWKFGLTPAVPAAGLWKYHPNATRTVRGLSSVLEGASEQFCALGGSLPSHYAVTVFCMTQNGLRRKSIILSHFPKVDQTTMQMSVASVKAVTPLAPAWHIKLR